MVVANNPTVFETRFAIEEMLRRYCWAHDKWDLDGTLEHFTEDMTFRRINQKTGEDATRIVGKEAFREVIRSRYAGEDEPVMLRRLYIQNILIEDIQDASATVKAYMMVIHSYEGRPDIIISGEYRHKLVKKGDKWLFREYSVTLDNATGLPPA
jgi:3-phenylpropionate/cinnamic acid dioxygenase small subunit